MRNFFVVLTILSLTATGGIYAWRTYAPEGDDAPRSTSAQPAPGGSASRGLEGNDARRELRQDRREAREERRRRASERQDWAMTASIASSIISALAAIAQAWFSQRAARPR